MSSNIPKKGDIIINPKTSRPVKVGSRTWINLVKEGLVAGHYTDPKELCEVGEEDDEAELIQQFNQNLPSTQQAVRGRGKYANKIVKRNKQPSTKEATKQTVRATARKLKDPAVYEQLQETDDFEGELEQLIMAELAGFNNEPTPVRTQKISKKYYTVEDSEEEDEEESEDY